MLTDAQLVELTEQLQAAAIPCQGLDADGRVDFLPAATAADRRAAADLVAAFDTRPRQPKPVDGLAAEIRQLAAADRDRLLDRMLAEWLAAHPTAGRKAGIPIDGDELAELPPQGEERAHGQ
jgi:hypothetical protein